MLAAPALTCARDDWSDHQDYSDHSDWRDYQDYADHYDYDDWGDHKDYCDHVNPRTNPNWSGCGVRNMPRWTAQPNDPCGPLSNLSVVLDIVTDQCNLRCKYCHENVSCTGISRDRGARRAAIRALLSRTARRNLKWILHGGEPLLVGREELGALVDDAQSIAAERDIQLSLALQTNGTLLSPSWAQWLADRRVRVGVSLDGPPVFNDVLRGHGRRIDAGLRHLQAADVRFGILCVLTRVNVGHVRKLVAYFESLAVRRRTRFRPVFTRLRGDREHRALTSISPPG
jgi:sulfatase maturation enzyme AslB (radical SAM superfamily)